MTTTASDRPRAVLFDVDGTLLDSNDAHARAWVEAGERFGYEIGFEHARRLIGMGGDKVCPALTGLDHESAEGKEILAYRTDLFLREYLADLRPFPGVRELLSRLRSDGLELVVASSASGAELKRLLDAAGATEFFDATTSSSDAEHSKPDPDIVEAAVGRAGEPARACVMIGDTPYDISAARRAGVRILAVRCGGWADRALGGAVACYEDPADILARYESTPFGH